MSATTFSKPIEKEFSMVDVTNQIEFAFVGTIAGGVFVRGRIAYVRLRITPSNNIAVGDILAENMPPALTPNNYFDVIHAPETEAVKIAYTAGSSSTNYMKLKLFNTTGNSLTANNTYVIVGSYIIEE